MDRQFASVFATVCLGSVLASACGSSASLGSQLAPSGSVTLSSLTITVSTPSVGAGTLATSTATYSNGTTSPVVTGYGTDTPSVATVTNGGQVTGVAVGDVTIFVDFQGQRASKKVHVLPGFGGIFAGTYIVGSCVGTGGFVNADPAQNFCTDFTVGRQLSIAMQNTQSSDLTTVNGLFALGGAQGSGNGAISQAGTLTYSGAVASGTTRMDFRNWTATSPTPGRITGSFEMIWTDSTLTGTGTITCTNMDMTRQASAATVPSSAAASVGPPSLRTLVLGAPARR